MLLGELLLGTHLDDTGHAGRWSADGDTILFVAQPAPGHHKAIYSLAIGNEGDGLWGQLPVAPGCGGPATEPDTYGCYSPSWSPDGDRIVFTRSEPDGSNESIWIVTPMEATSSKSPMVRTTTRFGERQRPRREPRATGTSHCERADARARLPIGRRSSRLGGRPHRSRTRVPHCCRLESQDHGSDATSRARPAWDCRVALQVASPKAT